MQALQNLHLAWVREFSRGDAQRKGSGMTPRVPTELLMINGNIIVPGPH